MTLTVNSCDELVFNTLEIYNIAAEDITDLSVQYGYNCSALTTVDLLSNVDTIYSATEDASLGTNFTLTSQILYDDETNEKFCEGVYYFKWSITADSVTYNFSICTLIDCENKIRCKIKDYYLNNNSVLPMFLYDALQYQNECDSCTCTEACKIYKKLSNLINLNTNGVHENCLVC